MMRALWTAATGMISQQTNVDTISNNLANINTTGFKKENAEFKTLLYQTLQEQSTDNNGDPKPYGVQIGLGVRTAAINTQYTQGPLSQTDNNTDFAIVGKGFFMVQTENGTAYTRNGSFHIAQGVAGSTLATSDGYPVLDTNGEPIVFDTTFDPTQISIDESGQVLYKNETGEEVDTGMQIGMAQFNNTGGLEKLSNTLYKESIASGSARIEGTDTSLTKSVVKQGFLEASNVQAVDEMVNLIVAQRAYEMNSKLITAADEMMQQANNLR